VARHSEAESVDIRLALEGSVIRLEIRDDGRGFEPDRVSRGMGLNGMRERVEALGGEFSIESASGAGVRVLIRVPATSTEQQGSGHD
jgi:two-component system sensor histidine kinase UhpB